MISAIGVTKDRTEFDKIKIRFYGNRFNNNEQVFSFISGYLCGLGYPITPFEKVHFEEELIVDGITFLDIDSWISTVKIPS
jgi:hypothetical protein